MLVWEYSICVIMSIVRTTRNTKVVNDAVHDAVIYLEVRVQSRTHRDREVGLAKAHENNKLGQREGGDCRFLPVKPN